MKKLKIVVLDGYALNPGDLSWENFREFGDLVVYDRTPAEEIASRAEGAEVLFTNKVPLRKEVLVKLPHLKFIGVLATGYNIIDVGPAESIR